MAQRHTETLYIELQESFSVVFKNVLGERRVETVDRHGK